MNQNELNLFMFSIYWEIYYDGSNISVFIDRNVDEKMFLYNKTVNKNFIKCCHFNSFNPRLFTY